MITIDDVKKVEIRAGKILEASNIPDSEKLLKLTVDFGEEAPRTILSGIAKYFPGGEGLAGTICGFVANLEPRPMMGMESQGMILAVSGEEYFSLLKLDNNVPPGSVVK
jgi:methionyl-tRNA synthetase